MHTMKHLETIVNRQSYADTNLVQISFLFLVRRQDKRQIFLDKFLMSKYDVYVYVYV